MPHRNICPKEPVSRETFRLRLAAAWGRVWPQIGKGQMADKMHVDAKTINRAVTGEGVPEAHTVFNSLCADPTALDEVLREYGLRICPMHTEAANDLNTAAGVVRAMGELIASQADGRRDHNETLAIVTMLRPWMPALEALVCEADTLRGAA